MTAQQGNLPRWRKAAAWLAALPLPLLMALQTGIVIAAGLLLVQTSMVQRAARSRAMAEADAQLAIKAVQTSLSDAETGQRGFLLTNDPAYLAPYRAARDRLPDELRQLRMQLMGESSPEQDIHLREIERLTRDRLDELDTTVRYAIAGEPEAAALLVRNPRGRQAMDALRGHLGAIGEAQRARRADAFATAWRAEQRQAPLLLAMWLCLLVFVWSAVRGERRRAAAEAEAAQTHQLRVLSERNRLLAGELDHRVKNMFGVVLALVRMAERRDAPAKDVVADLGQRIHALSRAHALILATPERDRSSLHALLENLLEPYNNDAGNIELAGDAVEVASVRVTPLSLIFHELATNSVKYGALSTKDGNLRIGWTARREDDADWVELTWKEHGLSCTRAEAPAGGGFGTRMIDGAIRPLGGAIERAWEDDGLRVTLRFSAG